MDSEMVFKPYLNAPLCYESQNQLLIIETEQVKQIACSVHL